MLQFRSFPIIVAIFLICISGMASGQQQWSGILAPTRATDWTLAGIPGYNNGTLPSASWTQCGPTIAAYSGSGSTILNALQHTGSGYTGCGANTYVQLGAGTFNLTSGVSVTGMSNDELRGMGASSTILNFSGLSTCLGGAGVCGIGFASGDGTYPSQPPAHIYNWTAGYSQGATSITVSSGTAIEVGTMVVLDQCDTGYSGASCVGNSVDNGGFFECSDGYGQTGSGYGCSVNGPDSGFARPHRFEIEAAIVTACSPSCGSSGSTVLTIDHPLMHPNWSSGQTPQVWLVQPASYVGVQNLTVNLAGCTTSSCNGGAIGMSNLSYYWVSGVSVLNAYNIGIWIGQSVHGVIQSNYVYNAGQHLNYADPTGIKYNWSNNLIQNNIVQAVRPFIQEEGPAAGNVVAYNFGINSYTGDDFLFSGLLAHSTGDDYNLYEGNIVDQDTQDQIHGSHLMQTAFRNLFTGWESCANGNCGTYAPKDSSVAGLLDLSYDRYYNAIANVIGTPNGPSSAGYSYQGHAYAGAGGAAGYPYYLNSGDNAGTYPAPADPIVNTTMMRWGNWNAYNAATLECTGVGVPIAACTGDERGLLANLFAALTSPSTSFPPSFYLSGRPSWYSSSIPFPAIGPDVSGGNLGQCGGVPDTSGQFGGVAATNSSQCAGQGLTASSWAGHVNAIPAMACYLDTMQGPPDGSGNALTFDASSCYGSATATGPPPAPSNLSGTVVQ